MKDSGQINYERIAKAIAYIRQHFREQPGLDEVAEHVHLSPFHFQRMFTEWAGVSPKKFLQYISLEHAKQVLKSRQATLFDAAYEAGLSGTGRLHDLFIGLEGMTPAEFRNGGEQLQISYSIAGTPFGKIITASTGRGICYMAFGEDPVAMLGALRQYFPGAALHEEETELHRQAVQVIGGEEASLTKIPLHVKGTGFQLKVWEALLKIPMGKLSTYATIAGQIGNPAASRAVGTAIGSNPVAFLIPCHRVIQSTGIFGGYMWGPDRKTALIGWEASKTLRETED